MRETAGEVTAEGDAEAPTTSTGPTSYAVRTLVTWQTAVRWIVGLGGPFGPKLGPID